MHSEKSNNCQSRVTDACNSARTAYVVVGVHPGTTATFILVSCNQTTHSVLPLMIAYRKSEDRPSKIDH